MQDTTAIGYSVFRREANNWKPSRDEEYSNLEVINVQYVATYEAATYEFNVLCMVMIS